MINWEIGLNEHQKEVLQTLLKEESKIQVQEHVFSKNNIGVIIVGKLLPKNKLVQERESGYTHYIQTADKLECLSAFSYKLIKSEEIR